MKKLTILLLLTSTLAYSQMTQVGCGEYATTYLTEKGEVFQTVWVNPTTLTTIRVNVPATVHLTGGQYHTVSTTAAGEAYNISVAGVASKVNVSGVTKAYGYFTQDANDPTTVCLMNNGTLTIRGKFFNTNTLNQPAGVVYKKLALSSTAQKGMAAIIALSTTGDVWKYSLGNSNPVKIFSNATDITALGIHSIIASTATDIFHLEGYMSSQVGLPYSTAKNVSFKSVWPVMKWPLKELVGNYNTLHIIDADNNMFAAGLNSQGEIGNGKGFNYITTNWNWDNNFMREAPQQIPGKWQNIQTSNIVAFYLYAQDMAGKWHSWGRNKTRALGNGINLIDYSLKNADGSIREYGGDLRQNYLDVWKPTRVEPLTVKWTVVKWNATTKPVAPVIVDAPLPPARVDSVTRSAYDSVVVANAALQAKVAALNKAMADAAQMATDERLRVEAFKEKLIETIKQL